MILAPGCLRETVEQMSIPVCSTEFVWGATVCRDHRLFLESLMKYFNSLITEHLPYGSLYIMTHKNIWSEEGEKISNICDFQDIFKPNLKQAVTDASAWEPKMTIPWNGEC